MEKEKFYGWKNAFLCFLIIFVSMGIAAMNLSLYTIPITEYYNISRTTYALSRSVYSICTALMYFLYGPAVKKFGQKRTIIVSLFLTAVVYGLYACGWGVWTLFVGAVISGISSGFIGHAAMSQIVQAWFIEKRGLLTGLVSAASGAGGALAAPVLGILIEKFGWQVACGAPSILILILIIPIATSLNPTPQEVGQKPYGLKVAAGAKVELKGPAFKEVLKDWRFYALLVAYFCVNMATSPAYYNITPHVQGIGYDTTFVTSVLLVVLLACNAISKPIMGIINDKVGTIFVYYLTVLLAVISAFMMAYLKVGQNAYAIACVAVNGFSAPASNVVVALVVGRLFGQKDYAMNIGVANAVVFGGAIIGQPITNRMYDVSGSYQSSYVFCGIMILIGIVIMSFVMFSKKTRENRY